MISLMRLSGSSLGSKNTCDNRLKLAKTTGIGKAINTAPKVPPRTIIAAVGWRICPIFPPSSVMPPIIPASATTIPAQLPLSTACTSFRLLLQPVPQRQHCGRKRSKRGGQQAPTKIDNAVDDFLDGFCYHDFLSRNQRDDSVRRVLHEFDQIRVHNDGLLIQPREFNHSLYPPELCGPPRRQADNHRFEKHGLRPWSECCTKPYRQIPFGFKSPAQKP